MPASAQPDVTTEHARVIRVVDGDTLKVRLRSGRRVYVRLLGIDTPEVFGGTVQCWGAEASGATARMLPVDAKVVLTSDPSQALKDRYHRLLRYVSKGGVDVGRKLVLHGHAEVYVYHHEPFKRVEGYRNAEDYAHVHDVGLWGSCKEPPPLPPAPPTPPSPPPPPPGDDLTSYPRISTYDCPTYAPIKGNQSSMIYHPPDSPWYAITTPEECFASEAARGLSRLSAGHLLTVADPAATRAEPGHRLLKG